MKSKILIFSILGALVLFTPFIPIEKGDTPDSSPLSASISSQAGNRSISQNPTQIDFKAGEFSHSLDVAPDSSVYDAMLTLASTTSFDFKSKYYSGLGYFIEEINSKPNAGGAYWTLYVNGKYSMVGASQHKLKAGDKIEWKFEKQ